MKKPITMAFVVLMVAIMTISMITIGCKTTTQETITTVAAETTAVETTAAAETTKAVKTEEKYVVACVGGLNNPFQMELLAGFKEMANLVGFEAITTFSEKWDLDQQTNIINALIARGDLDYLIVQVVDPEGMIPVMKAAYDMGIHVATVGTFLGDGIYKKGHPVDFPITFIGSDNLAAGREAGEILAKEIDYKGKVYAQTWSPIAGTSIERIQGFEETMGKYKEIEIVGIDYNDADSAKASSQMSAVLQREPDIVGVFGANTNSVIGPATAITNAGLEEEIVFIGIDSPSEIIGGLKNGSIDFILGQKPYEWGVMSAIVAYAVLNGIDRVPSRIPASTVLITKDDYTDPDIARWIYGD